MKDTLLGILGLIMVVVFWAVVGCVFDGTASLLVMWALEAAHVATNFWSASVVASAIEFIVILGTFIGVKAANTRF